MASAEGSQLVAARCSVCGKEVRIAPEERSAPEKCFDACPSCRRWGSWGVPLLWLAGMIVLAVASVLAWRRGFSVDWWTLLGLACDVSGGLLFVTGYQDRMMGVLGTWGAGERLQSLRPKQTVRVRWGICLLTAGFVLQGLGQILR